MNCVLLSIICLIVFDVASGRLRSDPEVDRAVKSGVAFILSKRNQNTLEWKPQETSAAILGLTSGDPLWRMDKEKSVNVTQTATALKAAFLEILHSHGNDLSEVDDSTLAQFISAFQTSCIDPTDLYGLDLVTEAKERLKKIPQRSPSLAGLVLPICNQMIRIAPSVAKKLRIPKRDKIYACESLCEVKAALNIMALSCMFKEDSVYSKRYRKHITAWLQDNVFYIQTSLAKQNYKSTFFDKIAILQANDVSPIPLEVENEQIFDSLLALQDRDGSFGNSVSLTALAIPALSNFNVLDIRSVKCPVEQLQQRSRESKIFYEISDSYLRTQTLVGEFETDLRINSNIHLLIQAFQRKYPDIFSFEIRRTPFGITIESLLSIRSTRISSWNVFAQSKGSSKVEAVKNLESYQLKAEDKVIFKYEEAKS